ncbi:putative defense protein 3 [Asterias amurensis]|uniref:putative defense protein 3 n=1 Tax=Asterias amurensis TaxID=7602 RepID=UPI003AB59F05
MEYIAIVLMLTLSAALGYKTGPPIVTFGTLCTDMIPTGHNNGTSLATDTANPPFTVTTSSDKYTAGGSLTVEITANGADVNFEGFFIQARRADPTKDMDKAVGKFAYPPRNTQLLMCHGAVNSSWAHSDDKHWQRVIAVWKAPTQDEGSIKFRATIVGEPKENFYVGVMSSPVTFMAGDAVTVTPPPPPPRPDHTGEPDHTDADGKEGTGCTHGISLVLSAAAFFMAVTLARSQ